MSTSSVVAIASLPSSQLSLDIGHPKNDKNSIGLRGDYDIDDDIARTNVLYQGRLMIQDTGSHGWGLFSERDWKVGDLVMQSYPIDNIRHIKDAHTIQYDVDKHANIDLPARLVNHVCGIANVGIQVIRGTTTTPEVSLNGTNDSNMILNDVMFQFYAIKDIRKGEEILWDYETTEYDMISKFDCLCGSPVCRTKLTGFHHHNHDVLESYGEKWVAPYLLEMLSKTDANHS